jgi:DNA recombination protein RmuC
VERLLAPISETLKKTDEKLAAIERERTESYAALRTQVQSMAQASEQLRGETGKLVKALREPHVRGRYGEWQLRRVAELAGMTAYCDFKLQSEQTTGDDEKQRPDMVVRLPNQRHIVVDAKTNIQAYIDAVHADTPDEQQQQLDRFARHVSDQIKDLARKRYWANEPGSPEFVVMFIPGDQFVDAALSRRPEILDEAIRLNVLIASPSSLIGLLRAVAVGYGEQRLAAEAATLRELGKELHERASAAFEHVAKLGKAIESAGDHFNNFVGSYERRLEPTLRRFEEANVKSAKELPEPKPVSTQLRLPSG